MTTENIQPAHGDRSDTDFLFLFATETVQKQAEYDAIFWANRAAYKIPARLRLLSEFVMHHSAVENGENSVENTSLKFTDAAPGFNSLRDGQVLHSSFRHRLKQLKIKYNPRRTMLVTEDSTMAVPLEIWKRAVSKLDAADPRLLYINTDVPTELRTLKGTVKKVQGQNFITVPDVGLIWTATGYTAFFNILREAGFEAGYKSVPLLDQISCALTHLDDPEGTPAEIISVERPVQLYTPKGVQEPIAEPDTLIPITWNYFCIDASHDAPIASYRDEFLKSDSTRKMMLDKLVAYAVKTGDLHPNVVKFRAANKEVGRQPRKIKHDFSKYILVQPTLGIDQDSARKIGHMAVKKKSPNDLDTFANALSMEFNFGRDGRGVATYSHADALIFPPFDNTNPRATAHNAAILYSAVVAKQMDPRYFQVPFVVMNQNGCWDDILKTVIGFANQGYSKDFRRTPLLEKRPMRSPMVTIPNVAHTATAYLDILDGNDIRSLKKAAQQVYEARLDDYSRLKIRTDETDQDPLPRQTKHFSVTVFSSASSDKWIMNCAAESYTKYLAGNKFALVTGGFDQHTGEALIKGYVNANGPHYTAISTHGIVKKETKSGRLPSECTASRLTRTITPRIFDLITHADMLVSFDGGAGTGQEDTTVLALKLRGDERVADKAFVIFDPNDYRGAYSPTTSIKALEIDAALGRGTYETLLQNHEALARLGIYLTTTMEELEGLTAHFSAMHGHKNIAAVKQAQTLRAG